MNRSQTPLPSGISVVVPVFNSEESLPGLLDRLETVLSRLESNFEVILVNDGSRDRSWETILELARQRSWIRGIRLMRNYGQHNALLCGIRSATFSVTVTLDDDGQNPPEEIPRLIQQLEEGCDLVYGVPVDQQHGVWRNLASRLTKTALQGVLGAEIARHVSSFKAFHTRLRDAFADYRGTFVAIDILLGWGAARVGSVRMRHSAREHGKSNYTFGRLVAHAVNMITSFSIVPLQLASIIGFFFTLFGIGVLVYVVARFLLQGASVAGFPFLASIIAIFSGAQLFALGIIGEYLARVHFHTLNKPAYAVAEEIKFSRNGDSVIEPLPQLEAS